MLDVGYECSDGDFEVKCQSQLALSCIVTGNKGQQAGSGWASVENIVSHFTCAVDISPLAGSKSDKCFIWY